MVLRGDWVMVGFAWHGAVLLGIWVVAGDVDLDGQQEGPLSLTTTTGR